MILLDKLNEGTQRLCGSCFASRRGGPKSDDQDFTIFLIKDFQDFSKVVTQTLHPANLFSNSYEVVVAKKKIL